MKRAIIIIEICLIVAGIFAINHLVSDVLNPDYTAGWQSREEWRAAGEQGGMPRDKDMYQADIMRKRGSDRMIFLLIYAFLVAGYYSAKAAHSEVKRRGKIVPADGMQNLNTAIVTSNRRIVLMRFMAILFFMLVALSATACILGHPMQNVNEAGDVINTNPWFGGKSMSITQLLFILYMPVALCIAPYFVFRKITNILRLRDCLIFFVAIVALMSLAALLHLPHWHTSLLANAFSGLAIARKFVRKADVLGKTLGL
ncbi:LMBR1 domain-containing protein [Bacteroides sp. 224]|uniref:LMBR1 domain-containing protein n=1 Tax=Bacteroides sp. 224 TaxID=2302936 RepID=UPI0013D6B4FE|nr:LMBR1 domain-containing protein [Bacteroides sp. 224]